jgi:hypothetical protein
MTDDDATPEEVEAADRLSERYRYSRALLLWRQGYEYLKDRMTPNQLRKRRIGRPAGSTITLDELEAAVDRLRRNAVKPTQDRLAQECHIARSTLSDWLALHPGTWADLRARWRGLK